MDLNVRAFRTVQKKPLEEPTAADKRKEATRKGSLAGGLSRAFDKREASKRDRHQSEFRTLGQSKTIGNPELLRGEENEHDCRTA